MTEDDDANSNVSLLVLGHLKGNLSELSELKESGRFKSLQQLADLIQSEDYLALANEETSVSVPALKLHFYTLIQEQRIPEALSLLKDRIADLLKDQEELARTSSMLFADEGSAVVMEAKAAEKAKLERMLPTAAALNTRLMDLLSEAVEAEKRRNPLHCPILCADEPPPSATSLSLFQRGHECQSFEGCFRAEKLSDSRCHTTNFAFISGQSQPPSDEQQMRMRQWDANESKHEISFLWPPQHRWPERLLQPGSFVDGKVPHCMAAVQDGNRIIWSGEDRLTMLASTEDLRVVEHCWAPLRASYLITTAQGDEVLAVQNEGHIRHLSLDPRSNYAVLGDFGPPERSRGILVAAAFEHRGSLALSCNNDTIYWYSDWRAWPHPTRVFRGHKCRNYHSGLLVLDGSGSEDERDWLLLSGSEDGRVVAWSIGSGRCVGEVKASDFGQIAQLLPAGGGEFYTLSSEGVVLRWMKRRRE